MRKVRVGKSAMAEHVAVGDAKFKGQHVGIGEHRQHNTGKQQARRDNFQA
ncbi:hypothetical protein SEEC0006_14657 [Salmonella enterica subsp. enterica serovar Choleraesuis str. 0006]|nr:hypothetical protein SEEC0006_14657 [Salmonella enterica subsp. enterica serovar Choleraesuis str. 0006]